jgi:hypothetical protein
MENAVRNLNTKPELDNSRRDKVVTAIMKLPIVPIRHAELVSASIAQLRLGYPDKWTLKRVQGDGEFSLFDLAFDSMLAERNSQAPCQARADEVGNDRFR